MKLTPEQKAFYEYGRARAWLKAHRLKELFVDVPDMGLAFWHMQRNMCGLNALIRDAWQKRAACRAVIVSNDCIKCIRFPNKYPGWKCPGCEWATFTKTVKSRWEPRKEGES